MSNASIQRDDDHPYGSRKYMLLYDYASIMIIIDDEDSLHSDDNDDGHSNDDE